MDFQLLWKSCNNSNTLLTLMFGVLYISVCNAGIYFFFDYWILQNQYFYGRLKLFNFPTTVLFLYLKCFNIHITYFSAISQLKKFDNTYFSKISYLHINFWYLSWTKKKLKKYYEKKRKKLLTIFCCCKFVTYTFLVYCIFFGSIVFFLHPSKINYLFYIHLPIKFFGS